MGFNSAFKGLTRFGTAYRSRLQGSSSALMWNVTRHSLVGTDFWDNLSVPSSTAKQSQEESSLISWPLKLGPIGYPKTSGNYQPTVRKDLEERRPHAHRGRSLKSPSDVAFLDSEASQCSSSVTILKGKGKAIPLQAWTGTQGSRRVRLPDFKTIGTWRW